MARIRFVLFMLFLSSLGVKGQQAEKYLSHPLPAGWQEQDAMFQQACRWMTIGGRCSKMLPLTHSSVWR